ncbi:MAG: alanine racemase [Desulfobacteraceae bacterium]|nr:alanine racemase [Desulfobacteraceae bacterium]
MQEKKHPSPLVWKQIDLDAIAHNLKVLKSLIKPGTAVMAVVKADGYGHGAVRVAETALANGADSLAVARFHEALELREAGIAAPILILGYTRDEELDQLMALDFTFTVFDLETAQMLSEKAVARGETIKAHLKIDTGMGRLGILPDSRRRDSAVKGEAVSEVATIAGLKGLKLEGIYTHFASADSRDKAYADYQYKVFTDFIGELKARGMEFPLVHCANSAAVIAIPRSHLNMVRIGITMYGLAPSEEVKIDHLGLKPAMEIHSIVTSVKKVPKAFKVGYGMTYVTGAETEIAAVPVGYADGYSRQLSSRGSMLVRGKRAPIAGKICMDQTLIDVGHIPGVKPGDRVVILGVQEGEAIPADEIARLTNTINYEVVSSLTARVPKVYSGSGGD